MSSQVVRKCTDGLQNLVAGDPEVPSGLELNSLGLHRAGMEQIVEVDSEIAHRAVVLLRFRGLGDAVGLTHAIESYREWGKYAGDNIGT